MGDDPHPGLGDLSVSSPRRKPRQMTIGAIRALVNELRQLQQRISTATLRQQRDWRYEVVNARRDIAARVGELSAMARQWDMPGHATALNAAFIDSIGDVRRALALHQAQWPAIAIDPASADFKASVGEIRAAYDQLLVHLGNLEQAVERGNPQENST